MKPEIVHRCLLPAVKAVFPDHWSSPNAQAMLLVIGLQETKFQARRQLVAGEKRWWMSKGPAVGFWQNERIGIQGIMEHHRAGPILRGACETLGYPFDLNVLYDAVKYDNTLAVVIARLMLWVDADPLPGPNDASTAWNYYLRTWRPGKPRPETWDENYRRAWEIVQAGEGA